MWASAETFCKLSEPQTQSEDETMSHVEMGDNDKNPFVIPVKICQLEELDIL